MVLFYRYLASGCSFKELHYSYRVGVSTISNIVVEVTESIWKNLQPEFMKVPDTKEEWENIADGFRRNANFPHCLGAVDGKHVRVKKPDNSGSMYFNYKEYFSIVLLAVVDSNHRFLYVHVGSYGKDCDSSIFKNSTFWKNLKEGRLNIPAPRPIQENLETEVQKKVPKVPFVLIGDEGFGLQENLLRPFGGTHLDQQKLIFNYRLTRARRYVEVAFGILANKWRIFHRPLDVKEETAVQIVKACTVLHNFVRERDGVNFDDTRLDQVNDFDELASNHHVRSGHSANSVRNQFMDYFMSPEGAVKWQNEHFK